MGADGHIYIVREEKLKEKFPETHELVSNVSTLYAHELDGVKYLHIYWGDNLYSDPFDVREAYVPADLAPKLKEILDWWIPNSTHWEVWT